MTARERSVRQLDIHPDHMQIHPHNHYPPHHQHPQHAQHPHPQQDNAAVTGGILARRHQTVAALKDSAAVYNGTDQNLNPVQSHLHPQHLDGKSRGSSSSGGTTAQHSGTGSVTGHSQSNGPGQGSVGNGNSGSGNKQEQRLTHEQVDLNSKCNLNNAKTISNKYFSFVLPFKWLFQQVIRERI